MQKALRIGIAESFLHTVSLLAYNFFHPYHIVPAVKFITAFMKRPHLDKSHARVKMFAVFGEIFVLCYRIAYTSVKISDVHFGEFCFKFFV